MKRLIFAFFILTVVSISIQAQTSEPAAHSACKLAESGAPNIRGLRLGMNARELFALFPGSADRREIKDALKESGSAPGSETLRLNFDPASYSSKERFARIDAVSATLLKGRLVGYTVTYIGPSSNGPVWRNVDEWIAKLAEAFNLPDAQGWVPSSEENPNKVIKCMGFEVEASTGGGTGSVTVRSTSDLKGEMERMNAEQEKKRREFKP